MKKKIVSLIGLCFMFTLFLSGCFELSGISNVKLETKVSPYSIWDNYYQIEQNYCNYVDRLDDIDQKTVAYTNLINNIDNRDRIVSILRNSIAAIQFFDDQGENQEIENTFYDFVNLENYNIVPDTEAGLRNYKISYKEYLTRHKTSIVNESVDNLIFNIKMPVTVNVNVSKNDLGIYTLSYVEKTEFPTEIDVYMDAKTDSNGNVTLTQLDVDGSTTNPTFTAWQTITNSSGDVIYSYTRELKFQKSGNFNYLTSKVTFPDRTSETKEYKLGQSTTAPITPIIIDYKEDVGYLSWDFVYSDSGRLSVFGESYYQGTNKFLVKEKMIISQGNPYNFTSSYLFEANIDGRASKLKFVFGNTDYEYIKDQNIAKFALYNNERNAIIVQTVADKPVLEAYL